MEDETFCIARCAGWPENVRMLLAADEVSAVSEVFLSHDLRNGNSPGADQTTARDTNWHREGSHARQDVRHCRLDYVSRSDHFARNRQVGRPYYGKRQQSWDGDLALWYDRKGDLRAHADHRKPQHLPLRGDVRYLWCQRR